MEESVFDEEDFLRTGKLFSDSLSEDKWVLYHGTNSIFEDDILKLGLRRHPLSKEIVEDFVGIFESTGMQLLGRQEFPELTEGIDGYLHVSSYTLQMIFGNGFTTKPIFLSAEAKYALTYTNQRFSGGETISGIRESLNILQKYCGDEKYRNHIMKKNWDHWMYRYSRFMPSELAGIDSEKVTRKDYNDAHKILTGIGVITDCSPGNWSGFPSFSDSREELAEQVDRLKNQLFDYLETPEYKGGIVLAVRFEESDLEKFRIRDSGLNDGYGFDAEIPSEKIVGVCRLADGWDDNLEDKIAVMERSGEIILSRREDPEDITYRLSQMQVTEAIED